MVHCFPNTPLMQEIQRMSRSHCMVSGQNWGRKPVLKNPPEGNGAFYQVTKAIVDKDHQMEKNPKEARNNWL